ncbi:MAG: hypothetical protein HPY89_04910 [Pelotomaculum sp.]|uniref:Recombinase domain-containing protein n=1 Tax=Pelotomaculum thermopropionicum (strain DSM 13744 / JCM 10971 / SI) TaxID=370438 RepID=A5CYM5_PELTS|nr:hypothetical protein [Pelotomaculum sp.]BAF60890.1 hypothetical protein PTH_2709 [Pelotomaculum thermopropionicum SI]
MFHQGHGYSDIQGELNKKGLKTKLGRLFSKNILQNKKYAGIYVFNRAASKSPDGSRNNHKSKSPEEVIEIKDAIPAIIPP